MMKARVALLPARAKDAGVKEEKNARTEDGGREVKRRPTLPLTRGLRPCVPGKGASEAVRPRARAMTLVLPKKRLPASVS